MTTNFDIMQTHQPSITETAECKGLFNRIDSGRTAQSSGLTCNSDQNMRFRPVSQKSHLKLQRRLRLSWVGQQLNIKHLLKEFMRHKYVKTHSVVDSSERPSQANKSQAPNTAKINNCQDAYT